MTYPSLTALPAQPTRFSDTHADQSDAWLVALAGYATEVNATIASINSAKKLSMLSTTFSMAATSVNTAATVVYDVTLTGVESTDHIACSPLEWSTNATERSKIAVTAYYVSANTVRVLVKNASAASATLTAGTWRVSAIRHRL